MSGARNERNVFSSYCRGEVINDKVMGHTAQKGPAGFQPFDDLDQRLPEQRPQKVVA